MSSLDRRTFMAGAAALPALAAPAVARSRSAPNVLFVIIDDLNDWVSPLKGSYPGVRTPNFERLARHARCYQQAYSAVPICNGARTSALFGTQPFHTGVYNNQESWTDASALSGRKSLPRVFRDAGYETIGCGKVFHQGWVAGLDSEGRDPGAWSEYQLCADDGDLCSVPSREEYKDADNSFELSKAFRYGTTDLALRRMADVQRSNWLARNVLMQGHRRAFFAALGISRPHLPLTVPAQFFEHYPLASVRYPPGALDVENSTAETNADTRDLPAGALEFLGQSSLHVHRKIVEGDKNRWKEIVRAYLATITFADHCLGLLLDALRDGPHSDNTIVVLLSDHGWQLGEKLGWKKSTLWERALRIPLFIGGSIRGERIAPGDDRSVASALDVFPTLCDLAIGGVPTARELGGPKLDGQSLKGNLLRGERSDRPAVSSWWLKGESRDPVDSLSFSVRNRRHRLIQYFNGDRELYDHADDPWEWTNLMARPNAERVAICDRLATALPDPAECAALGA